MKIRVNDEQKVNELLNKIQARSTARNLEWKDIMYFARKAEEKLNMLAKADRKGAIYNGGNCGQFPNAYQYTPQGTRVKIQRGSSDWFIIDCFRGDCRGNDWIDISDEQKKLIAEKAIRNVCHC